VKLFTLIRDLFEVQATPTQAWRHFFVEEKQERAGCEPTRFEPEGIMLSQIFDDEFFGRRPLGLLLCAGLALGLSGPLSGQTKPVAKHQCIVTKRAAHIKTPSGSTAAAALSSLNVDLQNVLYTVTVIDTPVLTEVGDYLSDVDMGQACALTAIGANSGNAAVVACFASLRNPTSSEGIAVSSPVASDLSDFLAAYQPGGPGRPTGANSALYNEYAKAWTAWQVLVVYEPSYPHGPTFPPDPWCECCGPNCGPPCSGCAIVKPSPKKKPAKR
jgi:hypothetical protein